MALQTQGFEDVESVDDLNDVDNANKADGRVLVYRSASGNLEYEDQSGGGGGSAPSLYYAQAANSNNLSTTLATIDLGTAVFADSGFSESGGVVTIGSALNGQRARVDWAINATGATNRVEIRSELQVDTGGGFSAVASAANYSARNGTQNTGGVSGFHYLTLTTGMEIRVQALRDGSTANKIINGTMLSIETKS